MISQKVPAWLEKLDPESAAWTNKVRQSAIGETVKINNTKTVVTLPMKAAAEPRLEEFLGEPYTANYCELHRWLDQINAPYFGRNICLETAAAVLYAKQYGLIGLPMTTVDQVFDAVDIANLTAAQAGATRGDHQLLDEGLHLIISEFAVVQHTIADLRKKLSKNWITDNQAKAC